MAIPNQKRRDLSHEDYPVLGLKPTQEDFPSLPSSMQSVPQPQSHQHHQANRQQLQQQQQQQQLHVQQQQQQQQQSLPSSTVPAPAAASMTQKQTQPASTPAPPQDDDSKWKVLGIVDVVKQKNRELSNITLGMDLTSLGLNLTSSDVLYPTFSSPWQAPLAANHNRDASVPHCYYLQNSTLIQPPITMIEKYSEDNLLCIFYSMPGDAIQVKAAQQLTTKKGWFYDQSKQQWLKLISSTSRTPQYITGNFEALNPSTWTKEPLSSYTLMLSNVYTP